MYRTLYPWMKMRRRTSSEGCCVGLLEPRPLPGPCCVGLEGAICQHFTIDRLTGNARVRYVVRYYCRPDIIRYPLTPLCSLQTTFPSQPSQHVFAVPMAFACTNF